MTDPLRPRAFTIDPVRFAALATSATGLSHLGVSIDARDPTGKLTKVDIADLDDASQKAWLQTIKNWKLRLRYQAELAKGKLHA
jgi:hypothetical protein